MMSARLETLTADREEGEPLGIAKGQRIRQIRLMEQFLNEPQNDEYQLANLILPELDQRVATLRACMTSRENM